MTRNLSQKRACHALRKVKELQKEGGYGKYVSCVKALPASIIISGMGQAMAMENAAAQKDGDVGLGHKRLYGHIDSWICTDWDNSPYAKSDDLFSNIISNTEDAYFRAQAEVMAYLEWLKKFAVAYLTDPDKAEPGDVKTDEVKEGS